MSANNTKRIKFFFFLSLTIIGCVLACTAIIPNDYLKLAIVMPALCVGMYGIMRGLSHPEEEDQNSAEKKTN